MTEEKTFRDLVNTFFETHGKPEHQQAAYDALEGGEALYPEYASLINSWRFCAAGLLNKPDLAIGIMKEGLDAGYWWHKEFLKTDEDLKSLQELPEFNRIVEIADKRYQEAMAAAKAVALPLRLPTPSKEGFSLLLPLHGNNGNAKKSVGFWESAVDEGWMTVLLQSSEIFFDADSFVWNDMEKAGKEIKVQVEEFKAVYSINGERTVMGGFSKGAEMAVWFTLMEILPMRGFIAVNPGGPYIQDITLWEPILENCERLSEMRGVFAGEHDPSVEQIRELHGLLVSKGMDCQLVIAPEIDHEFPENFGEILAEGLKFIGKNDS